MDKEKYNGWSNYETWAVKLHWDNNEGDHNYITELAEEYFNRGDAFYIFGDKLKEIYTEIFESVIEQEGKPTEEAKNMVRDVGAGHDVNWNEIANAYYEDIIQNQELKKKESVKT